MLAYCSLSDYVTVGYNETPSGVKPSWFDTLYLYSRIIVNPGALYSRIIVNPGTLFMLLYPIPCIVAMISGKNHLDKLVISLVV